MSCIACSAAGGQQLLGSAQDPEEHHLPMLQAVQCSPTCWASVPQTSNLHPPVTGCPVTEVLHVTRGWLTWPLWLSAGAEAGLRSQPWGQL